MRSRNAINQWRLYDRTRNKPITEYQSREVAISDAREMVMTGEQEHVELQVIEDGLHGIEWYPDMEFKCE